jgi:SHS2 domain-containing protein
VSSFADTGAQPRRRVTKQHVAAETAADLVAAAIEEVIYGLDTRGEIPVAVAARRAADGGIDLTLYLAGLDQVEITGAVPKAACLSGLCCGRDETGRWSCAVTIDV